MDGPLRVRQILRLCVLAHRGGVLIRGPCLPLEMGDAAGRVITGNEQERGCGYVRHQARYWPVCEALWVGGHPRCYVVLIT
jgi:hypothetical protein